MDAESSTKSMVNTPEEKHCFVRGLVSVDPCSIREKVTTTVNRQICNSVGCTTKDAPELLTNRPHFLVYITQSGQTSTLLKQHFPWGVEQHMALFP